MSDYIPLSALPTTLLDTSNARKLKIISTDGTEILGHSWGTPKNPAILLVHGFNQCELCWVKQVNSSLADEFHLITMDLRGHGSSGKPMERERYRDAQLWSDDVEGILKAADVEAAILVGWSMGSRVVLDYTRLYGTKRVVGINLVGAGAIFRPDLLGTASAPLFTYMFEEELSANIAATAEFVRKCFARQPTEAEKAEILAYNMVVPPKVREMIHGMPNQTEEFIRGLDLPVLVSFGDSDALNLLKAGKVSAETFPRATLSIFEGVGHSPFFEDSDRFNAELSAFARSIFGKIHE